MKIICDSREQAPLDFTRYGATIESGALEVGDYAPVGLENHCAVERKSLPDLVASLTWERERFERELRRSRGLEAFAVVIEGSLAQIRAHDYRSQAKPHAVLQSMTAFSCRYGVNWIWADDAAGAAYFVFHFLRHYVREAMGHYKAICKAHGEAEISEVKNG
ncbi:MAG: ERCC4 domain-containing protein [Desulfovibrionaceae bacterium]|nr:ERCC4 domain-containing protein [Desulfovibrionaceae bacterium]MBF0514564.1 ERCC4 domain-containing protein [Desulfovibrionaceae bacterium]